MSSSPPSSDSTSASAQLTSATNGEAGLLHQLHGLLVLHDLAAIPPLDTLALCLQVPTGSEVRGAAYGALYRSLVDRALAAGWSLAAAPASDESGSVLKSARKEAHPREHRHEAAHTNLLTLAIAEAVLLEETALSRWVQQAGPDLPETLLTAAAADLRALQSLASARLDVAGPPLPLVQLAPLVQPVQLAQPVPGDDVHHPPLLERLLHAPDWGTLAHDLVAHYAAHGAGLFARYRAFRWRAPSDGSAVASAALFLPGSTAAVAAPADTLSTFFLPVPHPDPVRSGDLIGYEAERELLRRNTAHFLAGYPANNALLYGDRGTGKSSSVKALLREQSRPGEAADLWDELRIVEVPKARLADFPLLAALLRGRPQRFIVFVDDLSFEEGETQYKDMKAMLEGGLEARPANVVVYATSNRRHLIREQFADRATPGSEEVHAWDTVQEKLSFADRFGLSITFASPDQAHYLAIVAGLAEKRGLTIEPAALRARAIEWAAWHNGRSGRTAKQFVDYLEGELGLASAPVAPRAPAGASAPA